MAKMHLGALDITSPAFEHGTPIPTLYTSDGDNVSPPLSWTNVPAGALELALVCHDPDAPVTRGFTHWVVYGIRPDISGIPEGGAPDYVQGANDMGNEAYDGPAPPPGHGTHNYYFHLYATDSELGAGPGLTREELLDRIDEHIIEQARLVGNYSR
jgi:Raf kinase inhibitor-like YbhB/YbcL family protein